MKLTTAVHLLFPVAVVAASGCSAAEETERTTGMNRLSRETSAYLLAHADNPVNWYAWGDEAFEAAEAENKPIFLSIGYSSCHWCHVMEEESFENPEVADMLNESFICVKVDREERPDVDNLYMRYTIAMTGGGGWPMTVVMTPEGKPFFAGTYIPRSNSFGRTGMLELLPSIAQSWENSREAVEEEALEIESFVLNGSAFSAAPAGEETTMESEVVQRGFLAFSSSFDRQYGGFGNAPKFPSPHNLLFLLRYWKASGDREALDMVTATLKAIRQGGIYDQAGFGVHRYSTDRMWLVPHFEKMLYDQALLSMAYLEAAQATGDSFYLITASEILDYVLRDMTSPDGGFFSSEDADSEQGEGAFYTWTAEEMAAVLTQDQLVFAAGYWNVAEGRTVLHQTGETALSEEEEAELELIREALLSARGSRPRPFRDEKVLADWNGLMIASFARASVVLNSPGYLDAAVNSFEFIKNNMMNGGEMLSHSYAMGRGGPDGFLDDYAFLIHGVLELYNATMHREYLQFAVDLQTELDSRFADVASGGYFFTEDLADGHVARLKESYDGAVPSGNSVELNNLLTLWKLTGDSQYIESARGIEAAFASTVSASPGSHTMMLAGILYGRQGGSEVKISGNLNQTEVQEMLTVLRGGYRPWTTVLLAGDGDEDSAEMLSDELQVSASVCTHGTCSLPVKTAEALEAILSNSH